MEAISDLVLKPVGRLMIMALIFVAVLLIVGVILRVHVPLFRWLYIPASVIAGAIGLAALQSLVWFDAPRGPVATGAAEMITILDSWPGWLIAVVFAGLLLERRTGLRRENLTRALREGLMVWIIVLGQTAVGLLVTWLIIQRFYDVPNSLGMLIETGFAGGHGTAAAMGEVYAHRSIDLASGRALGILMATAGLVYGIVSGILWINIGVRAGWAGPVRNESAAAPVGADAPQSAPLGYAVIDRDVVDPLLLQIVWVALAFGTGLALQATVGVVAEQVDRHWLAGGESEGTATAMRSGMSAVAVIGNFPLFIYTLFGGALVRAVLRLFGGEGWIDGASIQRLTAVAMDVLVVAAISSLNLAAVAELAVPFAVLFLAGAVWTAVCLLVISRRVLPREHWFQLGLINYGMSTGTTATGFVLLRIVDPELRTAAAEDYALATPLSAPFVGGGMLTIGLPLLLLERVPLAISAVVLSAIVAGLVWYGGWVSGRSRP